MNIKSKMLMPSLVSAAMLLVVGIVSFVGMREIGTAVDKVSISGMDLVIQTNSVRTDIMIANNTAYRLLNVYENANEARRDELLAEIFEHIDKATKSLQDVQVRTDVLDEERKALADLFDPVAKYRKSIAGAFDLATVDLNVAGSMVAGADKNFLSIDKMLNDIANRQKSLAREYAADGQATATHSLYIVAGVIVLGLIISVALALRLASHIAAPLLDGNRVACAIADGSLRNTISASSDDEAGQLLRALGRMQQSLRDLIEKIADNARQTESTTRELTGSLTEIDLAVAGQNDATSATAAAVQQMSVSINNIRDSARHSLEANQSAATLADEGGGIIQDALDEMMRIAATVKQASEVVEQVGRQSNDISSIVSVIREVADQTNLLALNAAIEAARAGEAGRGFAVVADEVRKLAEKTTSSAAQISQMIEAIQHSSGQAVANIQRVVIQVQETAEHASGARASINRIQSSVKASEMHAREIDAALNEQSQSSHLIAQQVEEITRMSDTNAQSVERAGASMRELDTRSRSLRGAVDRFMT